jgi:hypothetical protein
MGVTAFSYTQMQYLQGALKELAMRMHNLVPQPDIRPTVMSDMLARPEHRDMLKRTPKVAAINAYYSSPTIDVIWPSDPPVKLTVCTSSGDVFLPKKPSLQKDADPEAVEQITHWVNHTVSTGRDFGRAAFVLSELNNLCSTKTQMRYLFPSVVPLCRMNEEMAKVALAIGPFRVPKNLPPVPFGLREAAKLAAATVTAAMLLEPAKAEKSKSITLCPIPPTWEEGCGKFRSIE